MRRKRCERIGALPRLWRRRSPYARHVGIPYAAPMAGKYKCSRDTVVF